MTAVDCQRIRRELADEYEAVAEQWEAISVLTAFAGDQMRLPDTLNRSPSTRSWLAAGEFYRIDRHAGRHYSCLDWPPRSRTQLQRRAKEGHWIGVQQLHAVSGRSFFFNVQQLSLPPGNSPRIDQTLHINLQGDQGINIGRARIYDGFPIARAHHQRHAYAIALFAMLPTYRHLRMGRNKKMT